MVDKVPSEIVSGAASDNSVVHATEQPLGLSRSHDERGISRLQGTAPSYSASKTYALNDLVTQGDMVFRNIIAITVPEAFNASKWQAVGAAGAIANISAFDINTAYSIGDLVVFETIQRRCVNPVAGSGEAFDPSDWTAADSLGIKNAKVVYDRDDFPASVASQIPLADDTAYFIGGDVTIDEPLFIDTNFNVKIFGFSNTRTGKITSSTTGTVFETNSEFGRYSSVVNNGGLAEFTTINPHGFSGGELVNISDPGGAGYDISGATVTVTGASTFTTGQSFSSDSNGFFDSGADNLIVSGLEIDASSATSLFTGVLNLNELGSSFELSCIRPLTSTTLGTIAHANNVFIDDLFLDMIGGGFIIEDCTIANISHINGDMSGTGQKLFQFKGESNQFTSISQVAINTGSSGNKMLHFPAGLAASANPVLSDFEAHIHDNKDYRVGGGDLFETTDGGLIETATDFFVRDNGKQKNSEYKVGMELTGNQTINNALGSNVNYIPVLGNWINYLGERFSSDVNGIITYNGIEPISVLVNHRVTLDPNNGQNNNQLSAVIALNPDGVFNFRITNAGTGYVDGPIGVTIAAPGAGTTATATATAVGGVITAVTIISPGDGYTSAPVVTIDAPGAGTQATADSFLGDPIIRTESRVALDNTDTKSAPVGIGVIELNPGDQLQLQVLMNKVGDYAVGPANVILIKSG